MLVVVGAVLLSSCNDSSQDSTHREWPKSLVQDLSGPVSKKLVIVFDASGSMSDDRKIIIAKKAVNTYISALPDDVGVGVVIFGNGSLFTEIISSPISNDRNLVLDAINKTVANGGTPLSEAVQKAYDMLLTEAVSQTKVSEYHLAVVTDGRANNETSLTSTVDDILKSSPVRIFTIGFKIGEDHTLNQPGRTRYVSADNEDQLKKGLGQILAEKEE